MSKINTYIQILYLQKLKLNERSKKFLEQSKKKVAKMFNENEIVLHLLNVEASL